jgi:DNA (cytosine-5)-methyltransferase 1
MPHDLTHASFFSGVGGLDMGLERAGWRTVSFSEIDLYASAVLAERWPGVPNLGDITAVSDSCRRVDGEAAARIPDTDCPVAGHDGSFRIGSGRDVGGATLWTGGFPCQDLSVAGKRRGMGTEDDRTRSGLAYAFLDLVERHRPPAILLENVPGLLSSNGGKDFGALLGRLAELGYWWAYRILDAQFFGVPQRRRRVFICALHAGAGFGADSPAAVLSVGSRCNGHSAAGLSTGTAASDGLAAGVSRAISTSQERLDADTETFIAHTLRADSQQSGSPERSDQTLVVQGEPMYCVVCGERAAERRSGQPLEPLLHRWGPTNHDFIVSPSPDSGGVREADGLAGRLDDRPLAYRKSARVSDPGSPETWVDDGLANTLNSFDVGDIRTTHADIAATLNSGGNNGGFRTEPGAHLVASHLSPDEGQDLRSVRSGAGGSSALLPLGLDSHRYRCCGNGVVSNVSDWIGVRLARVMA